MPSRELHDHVIITFLSTISSFPTFTNKPLILLYWTNTSFQHFVEIYGIAIPILLLLLFLFTLQIHYHANILSTIYHAWHYINIIHLGTIYTKNKITRINFEVQLQLNSWQNWLKPLKYIVWLYTNYSCTVKDHCS